jgi:hypothetical protein
VRESFDANVTFAGVFKRTVASWAKTGIDHADIADNRIAMRLIKAS